MTELELALEQVTNNLDQRRLELTKLRRVNLNYVGTVLEPTAVRMAIPMIYAEWEGYVREVCQLYLEYVEATVSCCSNLQPALLGYLWTPMLRTLTGGLDGTRTKAVAERVFRSLQEPVVFSETEKAINTNSNLNFGALERIAASLCLDITSLTGAKKHLDALVHLRNNIAHGSPPRSLLYLDFDYYVSTALQSMEDFEKVVVSAIKKRRFCMP